MFTGIVEPGEVVRAEASRLVVRTPLLADCEVGASVAVNGVCLTVTGREADTCSFDLAVETVARTTLGSLDAGDRVNIERPVRAGAELGGHVVQGHVDAVGAVTHVSQEGDGVRMRIAVSDGLERYIVEKGSVTVDGVSLTVAEVRGDEFEVALIPTTLSLTTLGHADAHKTRVNIEVDVLAKYVEKLLAETRAS